MINRNCNPNFKDSSYSEEALRQVFSQRLHDARKRSKRRNLPCDITVDDLVKLYRKQGGRCYLSGEKMCLESHNYNTISLDRINPNRGYVLNNVGLVTWVSNQCKSNLPLQEFYKWCNLITKNNSMVA